MKVTTSLYARIECVNDECQISTHSEIPGTEMNEGGGESGGESRSESQVLDQVRFLESLVSHYDALVQDMSKELIICRNDMKNYIEKRESPDSNGDFDADDFRAELCRRDAVIGYLHEQVKMSNKSKSILKALWQSTLEQVEVLEMRKVQGSHDFPNRSNALPQDFLTKWKILQSYSNSLETRLEKSTREKNFFRNKIMEIRLEYETVLKKQAVEKAREIQQAKASYSQEIAHLKSSLEKSGLDHRKSLEKRLAAEREAWEYENSTKLQSIKLNAKQLVTDNELLLHKVAELESLLVQLQNELHSGKSQSAPFPVNIPAQSSPAPVRKYKTIQTDFDFIHPEQYEKLKTSQQQLEIEYRGILAKLKVSENESTDRRNRLQTRIQQLERLNANLQNQIISFDNQIQELQKRLKDQAQHILKLSESKTESTNAVVQEREMQQWKEDFLYEERVQNCERDMKILNLTQEISRLHEDRIKLLEVIEKQRNITSKWKAEFKELAKRSIS